MPDRQPRKLEDFGPLTRAEQQVLDELDNGETTLLGDGEVPPEDAGEDRILRARFVRWLALGGEDGHRLHEKGLRVAGALITGEGAGRTAHTALDLEGCVLSQDLALFACRFADAPNFLGARLQGLFLNDSILPGLEADRLETRGGVFLRQAQVAGEIRLLGAQIGGDLSCIGAVLRNPAGKALSADGVVTRGGVFLRQAQVTGEIRLLGAQIGGDLACDGAVLRNTEGSALSADGVVTRGTVFLSQAQVAGEIRLLGAEIGGGLSCIGAVLRNSAGKALNADGARIAGTLFLRPDDDGEQARFEGELDLTAAEIGSITDNPGSWPTGAGSMLLDRCRYGAFTGTGISAGERLRWLALQNPAEYGQDFWPQPYEHCAKVLREMGHQQDARDILIEKERLQRAARRQQLERRLEAQRWRIRLITATDDRRQAIIHAFDKRKDQLLNAKDAERQRYGVLLFEMVLKTPLLQKRQDETPALTAAALARAGSPRGDRVMAERAGLIGLWCRLQGRRAWDLVVDAVIGFGYRPAKALVYAAGVWLAGVFIFAYVNGQDAMMPNNAFVLRAPEWARCAVAASETVVLAAPAADGAAQAVPGLAAPGESTLDCFARQPEARDFPPFEPLVYSADTLLPIVALHQEAHWIPNPNLPTGWWGRGYLWLHIFLGWALSLLAVAGLSGIIKSD